MRQDSGPNAELLPWAWRPTAAPWFERFTQSASGWEPSPDLAIDRDCLRTVLGEAAKQQRPWLIHPCVSAITLRSDDRKLEQDLQLAVWCAANDRRAAGTVTVPADLWVWGPDGGFRVSQGEHELTVLGESLRQQTCPGRIALDVWAESTSIMFDQLWAQLPPEDDDSSRELESELTTFLRASTAAEHDLAACYDWVASVTKVVSPLRQVAGKRSNSSSSRQLPGLVFLTLQDDVQVLEALVHESAHHHLFLAEAAGTLVDPSHKEMYRSPLRPDPRPLLGILLAYHALGYMAAYYRDALELGLASAERLETEVARVDAGARDAGETLFENRHALTAAGREFVDRTASVVGRVHQQ